ncbi:hypothetical protein ACRAWF_14920 [Streptomyces sp. L7]
MAALARWCVRHRLAAVLLWLLAFGRVTAAAAVTGSGVLERLRGPRHRVGPCDFSCSRRRFRASAATATTVVWRTSPGSVRAAGSSNRP